jgi:heme exporter protein D
METGRHAVFIWSAYGLTCLVAFGLVLRAVLDHRAQTRALARLEPGSGPAGSGPRG